MEQSTAVAQQQRPSTGIAAIKDYFNGNAVKKKFEELLGQKSQGFITSLMQVVSSNSMLQKANPTSIYQAAAIAAVLDLPINNNLGFAWLVPFGGQAQFQLGWKGFVQLAQRSGQFRTIAACPVYEGQLITEDPLMGYVFDWRQKKSDTVIGYAAFFELLNGFQKTAYWTKGEVEKHAKRFSKSFNSGPWKTDFDKMAQKTVLKALLSGFAPMSIEMQKAVIADQAVIKDAETMDVDYLDADAEVLSDEERATAAAAAQSAYNDPS